MKTAVVYFSFEGNTKYISEKIAKELNADIIELIPEKEYPKGNFAKYFWCGKSALFKESPKLKTYKFNPDEYDVVILGTPVWAGTFAPPIRTFIKENDLNGKKVSFFACCSGGDTKKCFSQMKKETVSSNLISTLRVVDPLQNKLNEDEKNVLDFCERLKG